MAIRMQNLLVLFLLLIPLSSGKVEGFKGFKDGMLPNHEHNQDGIQMKTRKLLIMPDGLLDYDDVGANPKHDPRKKPGNGN